MSKKISPLEALKEIENSLKDSDNLNIFNICNLKVIEIALKEKENTEKTIDELFSDNGKVITTFEIRDKLKALEIIKKRGIDTETFSQFETYEDYQEFCENSETFRNLYGDYTQEEFDIVKEVLL